MRFANALIYLDRKSAFDKLNDYFFVQKIIKTSANLLFFEGKKYLFLQINRLKIPSAKVKVIIKLFKKTFNKCHGIDFAKSEEYLENAHWICWQ
jgi:hypothetical protein